ncbi:MAG TPA: class I SAM-dependent methyltransferase [Acidimicrobiales bacterium]|nr:class I SAM-dependent methyltransferase [Acidimicrobiales bacterium]
MAGVDYRDRAGDYRTARTLPGAVLAAWHEVIEDVDPPAPARVLDVGAGPGGFLALLSRWSGGPVVAVEPSAAMRTEAAAAGLGKNHPYVAGVAEALPLAGGSFGCAWLSTVVHQFADLTAAAAEVRRVVAPGGRALIRGFFSDIDVTGLLAFFPGIERSARSFPSTTSTSSAFESAGFIVDRVVDVVEPWRFHLDAWVDRVHRIRHVDSMLRTLTDTEFDTGVGSVLATFGPEEGAVPSDLTLRLLILR